MQIPSTVYFSFVKNLINQLAGNEYLMFDTALSIKATPHAPHFDCWGCTVSPAGELYVMDRQQSWYKVEPGKGNADLVVSSLFQRLKHIAYTQKIPA